MQGHPSSPDLVFQLSPEPNVSSQAHSASQPEPASAAASTHSAEPCLVRAAARAAPHSPTKQFGLSQIDYCCFHSPFHKLVRKAFARLTHIDHLRQASPSHQSTAAQMQASLLESEVPHEPHQHQHSSLPKSNNAKQDEMQSSHPQQMQSQLQQQASVQQSQATSDVLQSLKHSEQQQQAAQHDNHGQQRQQSSGQLPQQHALSSTAQASQLQEQQAVEAAQLHDSLTPTLPDRVLERQLVQESTADFEAKVQPGCLAGIELGNSYSGEHVADCCHVLDEGSAGYHVAS